MAHRINKTPMNFKAMLQSDVPQGRNGKHKEIVSKILSDLDRLQKGSALNVPLAQLAESKTGRQVATASDDSCMSGMKRPSEARGRLRIPTP